MINTGIIGAGGIVPFFLETTKLVKGYKHIGIANRSLEKAEALKEKYGIKYATSDFEKVLSDPKIEKKLKKLLFSSLRSKSSLLNPLSSAALEISSLSYTAIPRVAPIFSAISLPPLPNWRPMLMIVCFSPILY